MTIGGREDGTKAVEEHSRLRMEEGLHLVCSLDQPLPRGTKGRKLVQYLPILQPWVVERGVG